MVAAESHSVFGTELACKFVPAPCNRFSGIAEDGCGLRPDFSQLKGPCRRDYAEKFIWIPPAFWWLSRY